MALPGETEAGSAGKQPCPGIVRRAHRDDDHGRGNERLAPTLHPIGSKDPDALKIPARRAASTLTRSVRSPVLAEPAHKGRQCDEAEVHKINKLKYTIRIVCMIHPECRRLKHID